MPGPDVVLPWPVLIVVELPLLSFLLPGVQALHVESQALQVSSHAPPMVSSNSFSEIM